MSTWCGTRLGGPREECDGRRNNDDQSLQVHWEWHAAGSPDAGPGASPTAQRGGGASPYRRVRAVVGRTRGRGDLERQPAAGWCRYRRGLGPWVQEAQRLAAPSTRPLRPTRAAPAAPNFQSNAPPAVLGTATTSGDCPTGGGYLPGRRTVPTAERLSFRRMESPSLGSPLPADWEAGHRSQSLCLRRQPGWTGLCEMITATLEGAANKQAGVDKVKQGLLQYLQDIKYDDQTETKRGALVVDRHGKGEEGPAFDVVFGVGVQMDGGLPRANRRGSRSSSIPGSRTTTKKRSARSANRFASGTISRRRNSPVG